MALRKYARYIYEIKLIILILTNRLHWRILFYTF